MEKVFNLTLVDEKNPNEAVATLAIPILPRVGDIIRIGDQNMITLQITIVADKIIIQKPNKIVTPDPNTSNFEDRIVVPVVAVVSIPEAIKKMKPKSDGAEPNHNPVEEDTNEDGSKIVKLKV